MQCPKCKKEIEENTLKCSHCGAKVASVCKECGTINPITATECSGCHKILIKICSVCGAANLPNAKFCRKCNIEFVKQKFTQIPEYTAIKNSQQKIKNQLIDAINDPEKTIITISGESGIGKNVVLKNAINEIKNTNLIWMYGNCSQITQISPFGYLQDVLLSFFNINNFCSNTSQLKKNSIKFFKQDFPTLTNEEIIDLLNLLYPEKIDKYENLYTNKYNIFQTLKKTIMTIVEKMKLVFIIDNFENIDGMSFDFLKELLSDDYIIARSKFILLTSIQKPGLGCISVPNLVEKNYEDLSIAPFTKNQIDILISQHNNIKVSEDFTEIAYRISSGNPAIIEQMICLHEDATRNNYKQISYGSFNNIVENRLKILKDENIKYFRMLIAMSILGNKFYVGMLENFDNNNIETFSKIIEKLLFYGYITQINNLSFEFKSNLLWKTIVSIVQNDDQFITILNEMYEVLSHYQLSSVAIKSFIVQKLNNQDEAINLWTLLMKQASYIGDIGLYIITQKQVLKLIENKNTTHFIKVKRNIYTRVGKLLESIDNELAFEFLQKAIMMLDEKDECEYIELLGYLSSASMKIGNYWGVIECTESILNKLPLTMELERTLVKTRQVRPLLRLGNYGQVVNLVDTEILPIIQKYLGKNKYTNVISNKELYNTWIDIYLDYSEALTFQGDNKSFQAIQTVCDSVEKNKIVEDTINCRIYLALALANTIKGNVKTSNKILEDILKEYTLETMDTFIISRWNFIDILNKFIIKDYDSLYSDLFNVVAYANNVNDNFTKNILKTLLAKMLKDKNDTKKPLEILEEQVSYFAKEKIATGVLLSWYLIAKIRLITNGTQFALDIATKALDIAEGPNINNYFFISLYNKLIGEIYMAKQDFDSAQIYIEKSITIAQQYELNLLQIKGYLLYAHYYQELALPQTTFRTKYIKQAIKMFQLAQNVDIVEEHGYIRKMLKDELNILTSFCKLNGIILRKQSH